MARARREIPGPVPKAVEYGITQEELVAYCISDTTAKRHNKDKEERKTSLMERLAAGATVEPGALTPLIIPGHRDSYVVKEADTRTFKVVERELLQVPL